MEYLVSYGLSGEFGRFAPETPLHCERGDRVVVRTRRGIEVGVALCPVTSGHVRSLGAQPVRPMLRRATPADEAAALQTLRQVEDAMDAARRLADELALPIEVLDLEALAEPRLLVLHYLGGHVDFRPLVSALAKRFDARIELQDAGIEVADPLQEEHAHGCGSCGEGGCGEGGCGSCGTGGCGSCGDESASENLEEFFADLRMKMPAAANGHV